MTPTAIQAILSDVPGNPIIYLLRFSQRHAALVLIITSVITVVMGYFATQVRIRSDIESLIPKDEEMTVLIEKYGATKEYSDYLMLAVESDDPFQPEALAAFSQAIQQISQLPSVTPIIHPFSVIGFAKHGTRLQIVRPPAETPQTEAEISSFRQLLINDPLARDLLISDDQKVLSALFGTLTLEDPRREMTAFIAIADGLKQHYEVYYTGVALATYTGTRYVTKDMMTLLSITAAFILFVYYLGFRAFRAILLPMIVVALGTVWTIGFMGLLGYNITVASIATPPLVITLGSSYSIHILNQYYREGAGQNGTSSWVAGAVSHVNRTILLACATTVVGFGSLLATVTRQIREFGLATSVGIISCALLSLFFLPTALSLMRPPTPRQTKRVLAGPVNRLMKGISRVVLHFPLPVLAVVVVIAVLAGFTLDKIEHQYDYFAYFPAKERLILDTKYLARKLGGLQQLYVTLTAPNNQANFFLSTDVLQQIDRFEQKLSSYPNVVSTLSFAGYVKHLSQVMTGNDAIPRTRGLMLLLSRYVKTLSTIQPSNNSFVDVMANEDFSRLTIAFRIYNFQEDHYVFEAELADLADQIQTDSLSLLPGVQAELWGNSLRYLSVARIVNRDQRISMLISVSLIFLTTTFAFRSLIYGLCSLLPLVTGIIINFVAMALLHIPLDMTTIMVSSIAIGVGVDNSIHLLLQFRRQKGLHPEDLAAAITNTLIVTGRPILLTTASIVGGLLVLVFASFVPVVYFGILVSLTLFATALGSLAVLPVILLLLHRSANLRVRSTS